jgi:hypothetical protein
MAGGAMIMDEARPSSENNNPHHTNTSNAASISFDLTIELTASGDENEKNQHPAANNISNDNNNNNNTAMTTTTIVPKTITHSSSQNGTNKFKIVMPLISPDDGSVSVASAWDDEASATSVASKSIASYSTNPNTNRIRFQGITAYQHHHHPSAITAVVAASAKGGGEADPKVVTTATSNNVNKLQADIERQRSLRKRKEKALIKLAKELSKRTNEVSQKDQKIALQVDTIHQLEQQLLIVSTQKSSSNAAVADDAAGHGQTNTSSTTTTADDTTTHLRKELLRLQLSNDRLQAQLSHHHSRWPPALLAIVLVAILAWLLRSTFPNCTM